MVPLAGSTCSRAPPSESSTKKKVCHATRQWALVPTPSRRCTTRPLARSIFANALYEAGGAHLSGC